MKISQIDIDTACAAAGLHGTVPMADVRAFDAFLLQSNCAGWRERGGRYWLLDYDRPSPIHGGPTPADVPEIYTPCLQFLVNLPKQN